MQLFNALFYRNLLAFLLILSTAISPVFINPVSATEEFTPYQFKDPWEGMNRHFWSFNYNYLDKPIFRPVVHTYADNTSYGFREGVNNVVRNLEEPVNAFNHLLQGKLANSGKSILRFAINSTFGLFGIIDIMGKSGLERDTEEFTDVMGFYGVPEGPYLMIPVLGPSTVRQEVGDIVDWFISPIPSLTGFDYFITWGLDGLYTRTSLIDQEPLLDNSLDSYAFVKTAYQQYRIFRFYNGNPPEQIEDEFSEDLDAYMDELDGY